MSNRPPDEGQIAFDSIETQSHCPHCLELLSIDSIHLCPVSCCYIGIGETSFSVVCPYCGEDFETRNGHVCLVLIQLTEPAQ